MLLSKQVSASSRRFPIYWLILGLALLLPGGVICYSITHEHNRIDSLEQDRLASQAKVVASNLEHQLVVLNRMLVGIRKDLPYWKAQKNGKTMANLRLKALSDAMPGVRTLHITDTEGTVFASNRKELIGMNFREREYFRAARQGLNQDILYISPPFKTVLGAYTVNAVKVVLDAQGKFAGIISSTLDPEYCSVLLNSVLYTPGMRASIVHGDGKIFVEMPDRKDLAGMDLAKQGSRYTLHKESGRETNVFTAGRAFSSGDSRMSAWRTIRSDSLLWDKPLMVTVNRDTQGIFASWRRDAFIRGGLFALLALMAVFGLYFYQRRQKNYDRLTARYMAELQESEEKYRGLFQNASIGIFHSLPEGRFLRVNPALARMMGYESPEEMISTITNISTQIYVDSKKHFTVLTATLEQNGWIYAENRYRRKNGTLLTANLSVRSVLNSNGTVSYIEGFVEDISERKQAEEALHESEVRYRKIVEALSDAVLLYVKGTIIYANPAAIKLFRATDPGDLIGKRYIDLVHPDDRAISAERMEMNVDRIVPPREHRILALDGQVVYVESTGMPIKYQDQTQIFGVFRDISNRKRAEKEREKLQDQLLQSQKMESVGRLAGGVAHDFNNMLGVILGHAEMAMEEVDLKKLHADLEEIRRAANRSTDLTRQLLAFARKQTVSPQILDLNETVESMLKMLRRLIGEDINLVWHPGVNTWSVKMDPSQIDQILANLSVNARDAIAGVGKVTIETQNVRFDETDCADHAGLLPGEYVQLTVSDNGCGMDKEILGKLFEPFFTTKETGKGTGLGLATVYGIVKQNNGFIDVCSEPGQGTTFKVYLPRHIGKVEKAQMEGPQEPAKPGHETVLVVEDEPALLELSKFMLEKQGYRVLAAATPGEAIRLAEEYTEEIHLLMTDVVMPEMNGRELAKKMLSLYPNMKRLFMSGYTADVIAHHGVLDEGVHFLQKPFSRAALTAKVREALEGVA